MPRALVALKGGLRMRKSKKFNKVVVHDLVSYLI